MCGSGLRPGDDGKQALHSSIEGSRGGVRGTGMSIAGARRWLLSIEGGHELFNRNVPNDLRSWGTSWVGFEPGTPIVFEATYGWVWLAELLHEMGFEAHLAHPAACKAIASAKQKNHKVDARTLAQLLRVALLPRRGSLPWVRELLLLLRHRAVLVRLRTTLKTRVPAGAGGTRVRAVLADRGIDAAEAPWDGPGRRWLVTLELPAPGARGR